jgi:hypothetical protein
VSRSGRAWRCAAFDLIRQHPARAIGSCASDSNRHIPREAGHAAADAPHDGGGERIRSTASRHAGRRPIPRHAGQQAADVCGSNSSARSGCVDVAAQQRGERQVLGQQRRADAGTREIERARVERNALRVEPGARRLAASISPRCPIRPNPVTSVIADAPWSRRTAAAARLDWRIAASAASIHAALRARRIAPANSTPVPSGRVRTSASPALSPPLRARVRRDLAGDREAERKLALARMAADQRHTLAVEAGARAGEQLEQRLLDLSRGSRRHHRGRERVARLAAHREHVVERMVRGDLAEDIRSSMKARKKSTVCTRCLPRRRDHGGIVRRVEADDTSFRARRREAGRARATTGPADLGGASAAAHLIDCPARLRRWFARHRRVMPLDVAIHPHPAPVDPVLHGPQPRTLGLEDAARRATA